MRHMVFSLSVYGPDVPIEQNRRRLQLLKGMSVPSLCSQTTRFEWFVAVHREDPLLVERVMAINTVPYAIPVMFDPTVPRDERAETVEAAVDPALHGKYLNAGPMTDQWTETYLRVGHMFEKLIPQEPLLLTRMDDDDAFARTAFARLHRVAEAHPQRTPLAWVFPKGYLLWETPLEIQPYTHPSNGFLTLQTSPPSVMTPHSISHNRVSSVMRVLPVDHEPGWLQLRHVLNVSKMTRGHVGVRGRTEYGIPLKPAGNVRGKFDIDWSLFDETAGD